MQRLAILSLMLLGVIGTGTQYEKKMPKKVPGASRPKPECAQGSVCLSGEVAAGQTFRKDLNADLAFVITLPGNFEVVLKNADQSCKNHFSMANPPFRAHRQNEIDAEYDLSLIHI